MFIIKTGLRVQKTNLDTLEKSIDAHSPLRQLALGYSIVTQKKKIVKSISEIKEGSHFEVQFSDGIIDAEAFRLNKHNP